MLISYNWLKRYIKEIPNEEDLANLITFKICELESVEKLPNGDTVFDMKILPDRAHDLLSHRGVAKEIAGILGVQLISKSLQYPFYEVLGRGELGPMPDHQKKNIVSDFETQSNNLEKTKLQIDIQSPLCRRYIGRIVRGIKVGPSPEWMVKYLESVGQRSINNIVDVTNFILFDTGQPIHIFDLDKLESEKIIIRNANDGERVELLGEKVGDIIKERSFELRASDLVISDEKDVLALAGVKGGKKAEVDKNTKNILIEVANFDPVSIRRTAGHFKIHTDAVKRYENELTPIICEDVMEEVTSIIKLFCPNVLVEEFVDIYKIKQEKRIVKFKTRYICKILGVEIKEEEIEKILKDYGYRYAHNFDLGEWELVVPDKRLDITGAHDIAEEIGRVYGYDKIEPKIPDLNFNHKDNEAWTKICLAKDKLIDDGYKEVMTYSLVEKGKVEIMASASDKSFLRENLLDGLLKSYEMNRLNSPLLDLNEIKIFEVGTVFNKEKEEVHVAYCDKKNKIEKTLDDFVKEISVGDNSLFFDFKKTPFEMWSSYPFISRDVSFWAPEDVDEFIILKILKDNKSNLLIKDPYLFDKFKKENKISYAYRFVFQSKERTLRDDEVEEIMQNIYKNLSEAGFEIR